MTNTCIDVSVYMSVCVHVTVCVVCVCNRAEELPRLPAVLFLRSLATAQHGQ